MRFRDHSNIYVEILISLLTLVPIPLLIYFYPSLPERIPEYMDLAGNVTQWGAKSFLSVFRLPLMAIDIQILCLLTKFGIRQSDELVGKLIDWLRIFTAIKLAVSSVEPIVYGIERSQFLSSSTRGISWIASAVGVAGVFYYGWQLRKVKRKDLSSQSNEAGRSRINVAWVVAFVVVSNCFTAADVLASLKLKPAQ